VSICGGSDDERPVPVHRQFGTLDHRRSAHESRHGAGKFRAYSAGSHPRGEVNPFAIEVLERHGVPTAGLRSKSWGEFATPEAPDMDLMVTVCDQAAQEECPYWPGSSSCLPRFREPDGGPLIC
jgi:protein-tyrosine-phosphatase